jgi:hypothetical protein
MSVFLGFRVGLLALCVSLSSCVTTSKLGAEVATTNNPARVKDCQFIGDVKSSSHWGGLLATGLAHDNALKTLKNEAGKRGGNIILFSNVSNTLGGTRMSGEAYKCK